MFKFSRVIILYPFLAFCIVHAAPGESGGIISVFPSRARNIAMGEVGTALADDESVLLYNPAGLAKDNDCLKSGSISNSYQNIMPELGLNLWQMNLSVAYKPDNKNQGGFGLYMSILDNQGMVVNGPDSEFLLSLSHSLNLKRWDFDKHFFGYTIKYIQERHDYLHLDNMHISGNATNSGPYFGRTFAIDIGYIFTASQHINIGLNIANMGPAFHIEEIDYIYPCPFTISAGCGYTNSFNLPNKESITLSGELRLEREVVKTYKDKDPDPFIKALYTDFEDKSFKENLEEVIVHIGMEAAYKDIIAVRLGYLYDHLGDRVELLWGLGTNIYKHFGLDFYVIHVPDTNHFRGVRNFQFGLTISAYRIFDMFRSSTSD